LHSSSRCQRQDLNLHRAVINRVLCPLSYAGVQTTAFGRMVCPPISETGVLPLIPIIWGDRRESNSLTLVPQTSPAPFGFDRRNLVGMARLELANPGLKNLVRDRFAFIPVSNIDAGGEIRTRNNPGLSRARPPLRHSRRSIHSIPAQGSGPADTAILSQPGVRPRDSAILLQPRGQAPRFGDSLPVQGSGPAVQRFYDSRECRIAGLTPTRVHDSGSGVRSFTGWFPDYESGEPHSCSISASKTGRWESNPR
jgi:hypothetical protein